MKAQELRIGNYVQGINEQEIDRGNGIIEDVEVSVVGQVVCLDSVDLTEYIIWLDANGDSDSYESIEPIPLTEEWLLKFGYVKTTTYDDGTIGYWNKYSDSGIDLENKEVFVYRLYGRMRTKTILYVHQLQNLYHSLTGEELKVSDQ